jgi:hypothetical protein
MLNMPSAVWGLVLVTIGADGKANPASRVCSSCVFYQVTKTTVAVVKPSAASALSRPVSDDPDAARPMPVANLDLLHFEGTENDTILIEWRS